MSGKLKEVIEKLEKANNLIRKQQLEIERLKSIALKRIVMQHEREQQEREPND